MEEKERVVLSERGRCPYCDEEIEITVKRKTLEPGKRAVTTDRVQISKAVQTTL